VEGGTGLLSRVKSRPLAKKMWIKRRISAPRRNFLVTGVQRKKPAVLVGPAESGGIRLPSQSTQSRESMGRALRLEQEIRDNSKAIAGGEERTIKRHANTDIGRGSGHRRKPLPKSMQKGGGA